MTPSTIRRMARCSRWRVTSAKITISVIEIVWDTIESAARESVSLWVHS